MAKKMKKASHYLLILVLVGMLIGFNLIGFNHWPSIAESATVGTSVSVGNVAPSVLAVSLGTYPRGTDGQINLTEGSDIEIVVSATVTDSTCADIDGGGVKAFVFISSAAWEYDLGGTTCSWDYNDCYTPDFDGGNLNCVQQSCAEGVPATAYYDCTASGSTEGDGMWYHASPTDGNASYSAEWWYAMVIASDSQGADSFATSSVDGVDVMIQAAIDVGDTASDDIAYDAITPGGESATPLERGVENTGNRGTNITIQATGALEISTTGEGIATEQQEYGLVTFNVAEGDANATSLSITATELDVELPKPQAHTAGDNDDQIFWGIAVPAATSPGLYSGQTTYSTITD